jgi:hypothetical protein
LWGTKNKKSRFIIITIATRYNNFCVLNTSCKLCSSARKAENDSQTQHVATSTVYVRLHCGILRPITLLLYSSPSVQISSHEDREGQTQALRTLPDSWTNGEARCTQTASKQADHNKSTSAFISFIVGRCDSPSILTRFHDSLAHSQRPTVNGTLPSARPDARMFRERCVRHGTRMKPFQKMHSKEHG